MKITKQFSGHLFKEGTHQPLSEGVNMTVVQVNSHGPFPFSSGQGYRKEFWSERVGKSARGLLTVCLINEETHVVRKSPTLCLWAS